MIQTRGNIFETNSSSTHTLVISTEENIDKWMNDELYYCIWYTEDMEKAGFQKKDFYTEEEVKNICEKVNSVGDYREEYFITGSEFCDCDALEISQYKYTTPGGEKIRIVAQYGYDG